MRISLDFETYSATDLLKHGVYRYVADPSFDLLCASFAIDGGPIQTWWPGTALPAVFAQATRIDAWNAAFERLVWHSPAAQRYGFPHKPLESFHCTAARARAFGVPGALDKAARFLNLPLNKDYAGLAVLRQHWSPQADGTRLMPTTQAREAITNYCENDVVLEQTLSDLLPELSEHERKVYLSNELCNDLGVKVDTAFVDAARALKALAEREFSRELTRITLGAIESPKQSARILSWLAELGCELPDLTEDSVSEALEYQDLHPLAAQLLTLRQEGAYAAISKFDAIANRVCSDGRLRGAFVYCGAVNTGRFASFGVQMHNMRREVPADMPQIIERALAGEASYAQLAACVRGAFIGRLTVADYSQIEARVLPWLTLHPAARQRLMLFEMGVDIYPITASQIYRCDPDAITPEQRQGGKVADLALGFQGGARALQRMGAKYGLDIPDNQAERIKHAWRAANPWAVAFWRQLETALFDAISRGRAHTGRIAFLARADRVQMVLPSGRALTYHGVSVEDGRYGPQVTCLKASRPGKRGEPWTRHSLYGGLLAENATQATARDVLVSPLISTDAVVLHVHDELVTDGGHSELRAKMEESLPTWADGLPIASQVHSTSRYGL